MQNKLAILGGEKSINSDIKEMISWPIVTREHEEAVLEVLRRGAMSAMDVTKKFEKSYAEKLGMKYALACNNGTAAIQSAFYGLGVGVGDEVICPSITYWASVLQVYSLGATPVFADVDPETLCIDPDDIESKISDRTKVIVAVHYTGMPADMDAINQIAKKYNLKVFEDCSHAHGSLYKGREVGTLADASGFSLMSGKSFVAGEGGIMFTNDQKVMDRALLFGHYGRHEEIETEELKKYTGLPCGGYKYRMHQLSSAFGLVQLKYYDQQMREIAKAMTYFCDMIEKIPGIKPMRPEKESENSKGGWYFPLAHYDKNALGGLSIKRFCDAVSAEGSSAGSGCNTPLHLHPAFNTMDIYGHGKPTRLANVADDNAADRLINQHLPVAESINSKIVQLPWFKFYRPEIIKEHANAYKKVAENYEALLIDDQQEEVYGGYSTTLKKK